MDASEINFLDFLQGPKQFIIPLYQRPYSWTTKECEQLWNDMSMATNSPMATYFIGSIVYVKKGIYHVASIPKLLVIDGQQRITTISLMLLAICKVLNQKEADESNVENSVINTKKLFNYYLINSEEEGDLRYKIILTKSDRDTLISLIDDKEPPNNYSKNMLTNYNYLKNKIMKKDIEKIYEAISKLIIIDVALDSDRDNPQLIFESLNSTGKELTQADLIRNFILMGLNSNDQEVLYKKYWYPMEENFSKSNYSKIFDRYIRDYLTIRIGKIPNITAVYSEFKKYARNIFNSNIADLVKEIFIYSKYYAKLTLNIKEEDPKLTELFHSIIELKVDVAYPFLLQVYNDYASNILSREDFIEILKLVESFVFRRAICGIPTNALNKIFAFIYREIDKNRYVESFKLALILKSSYQRFPRDDEFKKELLVKDVYNFRNKNYLFEKLENYNSKELVDINKCTIEHILPQNEELSEEWKKELGEKWKEIQEYYLHTIGNLTLTAYNTELSDRSFKEKRDMIGGFKDSRLHLNKNLATIEHWNEESIKKRAIELSEIAIKIWAYPELDQGIIDKYKRNRINYTLDDHKYLEGNTKFLFNELRKRVLGIDSSIREEVFKLYIAYKVDTNFLDVEPHKTTLKLFLNMKFNEIKDPQKICRDVTGVGHWGNGDVQLKFSSIEQLDYIMFLIKQSYEKQIFDDESLDSFI